jgi:hypothetical protein
MLRACAPISGFDLAPARSAVQRERPATIDNGCDALGILRKRWHVAGEFSAQQ